eukprot:CAMPEP_0183795720 /NCGR_PEP_ID=MMETSP0803_2-20130417/5197_1 /TAXON_ID=195967 /ORGANISM="Crustomastix stigmata, Strain CCMP3273" /LENGTH=139 /DNA_ID=CAMNT_0026040205 /DNA_START=48 /DNA_END=467 /DNA_ORIENTATION=+
MALMQKVMCSAKVAKAPAPKFQPAKVALTMGASLVLAANANAATIKLGSDSGELVFSPAAITVKTGEKVEFVNNRGFPHNVVFDEDAIPDGVSADAISHEDYLNGPGETVSNTFDTPGTYEGYCEPHQGAGMKFKITVQ